MKRVLLALIVLLLMIGCSSDTANNDEEVNNGNLNQEVVNEGDSNSEVEEEPEPEPEPEPDPVIKSWKDGMYKVGQDIPAGEYVVFTNRFMGYVEVNKDSSGTFESIISNENISGNYIITLVDGTYVKFQDATAYAFGSEPTLDYSKEGHFKVGVHVPVGEYRVVLDESATGMGYIEVQSNSSGLFDSIVSNDILTGDSYITLVEGQYIKVQGAHLEQ